MSKEDILKADQVKASLDIVADKVFAYGCAKDSTHKDTTHPKRDGKSKKKKLA